MAKRPDLTQRRVRRTTLDALRRFNKALEERVARMATTRLWAVVVLVASVEAYLQDVLSGAARVDPTLMATSTLRAPYADILAVTSLDELANELRGPWARAWLTEERGPTGWLGALTKMGAPPYPDEVVRTLERMWGIRHVVVHRAGVADAPFLKRHPGVVKAVGERVPVSNPDIGRFLRAVTDFVNPTDLFFLKRWPALLASPPAAPSKP